MVKRRLPDKTNQAAGNAIPSGHQTGITSSDARREGSVSSPVTGQLMVAARPVLSILVPLVLVGCGSLREYVPEWGKTPEDDPLRGRPRSQVAATRTEPVQDRIPAPAWTDASRPRQPETSATAGGFPDMPAVPPVLPPSPARLASVPPLKGSDPLAIESPARLGKSPPIQQTGAAFDAKTAREQALEQLRARGANWHQSEPVGGQWRLRCTVPDPNRSDVSRFYEAYGADELAAIWAVIQQIDEQRQRSPR